MTKTAESDRNTTSALWNSGIDLGASLGGTLLGLGAARYGYGVAIWAIPVIVLIALPLLLAPAERHAGAEPSPDDRLAEPAGAIA